ncbi:hypothetical protein [Burkholderia gladioli]|uniref:hypothetical protein n=1 Tax=Burkholderia gladioli TaxID=28095 RepID=UPI00163FFFEF|nr:hypothetical protein [Burkholderia gladioli]
MPQDFTSLDTSRNATATSVAPARSRDALARVKAFYADPSLPTTTRVKRAVWTLVAVFVVILVVQRSMPHRPDEAVAPPPVPVIQPAPVAPERKPLPPDTAKMFSQQELDQKRDAWVDQTQAMASDTEKRAPGSLGAYQARSFADFLAAHCGKPGGCLKK